jgi:hypothetical protein
MLNKVQLGIGERLMNTFETSATVADQGEVRVAGVPFAPGTEVAVRISPKMEAANGKLTAARDRMRELFRTVKGFRMTPKLAREDLYDR